MESCVATVGAKWEFFHEWKGLTELDHVNIELPTMLRSICRKENLLDMLGTDSPATVHPVPGQVQDLRAAISFLPLF